MKLATRIKVEGDEGSSWRRGLKLEKATKVEVEECASVM
jgi:hypothetical protein